MSSAETSKNGKSTEETVLERIEAIKTRCEAATPGPWTADGYGSMVWAENPYGVGQMCVLDVRGWGHLTGQGACRFAEGKAVEIQEANGAFLAHARDDVPYLLALVESLTAQLQEALPNGN